MLAKVCKHGHAHPANQPCRCPDCQHDQRLQNARANRRPAKRAHWTAHHRRLRATVLQRSDYTCHYCGRHADTIDYVQPLSRGGEQTTDNAVAACRSCNSAKGAR